MCVWSDILSAQDYDLKIKEWFCVMAVFLLIFRLMADRVGRLGKNIKVFLHVANKSMT